MWSIEYEVKVEKYQFGIYDLGDINCRCFNDVLINLSHTLTSLWLNDMMPDLF